jgi:glycosyltransferase involved in cell wall biosynthesis
MEAQSMQRDQLARPPRALLIGYGLQLPSFRHRMQCLVEELAAAGWQVRTEQLPSRRYGIRTWERRSLLRWADVSVLHQIKLGTPEAQLFAHYSARRVFDVDDAIYVRKPRRLGELPDESIWRRRKFDSTCRLAQVVVVGNEVLAAVARRTNPHVEILPTSVDVTRYPRSTQSADGPVRVVWIGSPENLVYLELLHAALARLTRRFPTLVLRVICSAFPDWSDVAIERVQWSAAGEGAALAGAHIGIMPLTDDEWARGKCAFKLLQYMAAGLPCVASPIGANAEAVIDGRTGFHARDDLQWEAALQRLIESVEMRRQMGAAGRAHVEQRYSSVVYRNRYRALFERLVSRPDSSALLRGGGIQNAT